MGFRGPRIRELREAQRPKLSQTQLGEKAGASQATISRLEKGEVEKRPDRGLAVRIARVLGVKLEEIWDSETETAEAIPQAASHPGADATTQLETYEKALYGAGSKVERVRDVDPALAALRQLIPLVIDPVEPEEIARELLAAVAALRESRRDPTPLAIVAHVAMEAMRRAASPPAKKTRAA